MIVRKWYNRVFGVVALPVLPLLVALDQCTIRVYGLRRASWKTSTVQTFAIWRDIFQWN